jgi:hypothetical protein
MQIINTYTLIDNIPVVNKSENHVSISLGKEKIEMSTATEYKGIKINQNLPDSLFKVQ